MPALMPILALLALGTTVASAAGRCPLYVPVLLLSVALLLQVWR